MQPTQRTAVMGETGGTRSRQWYLVGSSTGAVIRRKLLVCIRRFHLRARLGVSVTPFPPPATSPAATTKTTTAPATPTPSPPAPSPSKPASSTSPTCTMPSFPRASINRPGSQRPRWNSCALRPGKCSRRRWSRRSKQRRPRSPAGRAATQILRAPRTSERLAPGQPRSPSQNTRQP